MERICWQKKTTWPLSESQRHQQPKWSLTVQAGSYRNYLMKNNKITRKNESQANLDNFVLRKRLVDKDSLQRYDYHQGDTSGINYLLTMLEYNWIEISMILLPQHRFKLQLILLSGSVNETIVHFSQHFLFLVSCNIQALRIQKIARHQHVLQFVVFCRSN